MLILCFSICVWLYFAAACLSVAPAAAFSAETSSPVTDVWVVQVAAQREELIMQLSLSVAAIEEDKEKKEQALEQDQRCHWYQTCDEMLPFDSALGMSFGALLHE